MQRGKPCDEVRNTKGLLLRSVTEEWSPPDSRSSRQKGEKKRKKGNKSVY
jgi:hypothetical protein